MRNAGRWFVGLFAVLMLAPFLYMVALSLTDVLGLVRGPRWLNYREALAALPVARVLLNSALVATGVVVGQVATSGAAGYALARLRFPGRDRVLLALLSVLLVPAVVLVVPQFLVIDALGWVNTYAGLISTQLVSVWGILLTRRAFLTLPADIEDAARLDGADEWTIFWRISLPLVRPALVTVASLAFVDQWKSFLWPLVATRTPEMQVAELGLAAFHGVYATHWPYQMAVAVTVTLPVLLVFLVTRNYMVRGVKQLIS